MSDDLEPIPVERSGEPHPPATAEAPPRSPDGWRRRPVVVAACGLLVAALVTGWLVSAAGRSPSGAEPQAAAATPPALSDIVCPGGADLAGTDLAPLGSSRETPEATVAAVARSFKGYPAGGYRYHREQRGGDWVGFVGMAGTVPKARISVRHVDDRWLAVAIAACAGDYPAGLVDYPADRPVPALASTAGLLLAINDPLQRSGPVATVVLQDAAGHKVWELPRIGAWYPTPLSWSPDGRRFLLQVSAGEQTDTRAVLLPDGHDVAVPGALTWIGDDAVLVWRDGHLGRLDLGSGNVVAGPPLTQYVTSHAGTRGQAALVILPGVTPGSDTAAQAPPPFVRIVDAALQTRDTVAPPGIVDCFSPAWTSDGLRLDLVCRRSDPPPGSSDTDVYEIDSRTLQWTRLPAGSAASVEQTLRSPAPAP